MNRMKYDYKRKAISVRVSDDCFDMLNDACKDMAITKQDYIIHSILYMIDNMGMLPDNKHINKRLTV